NLDITGRFGVQVFGNIEHSRWSASSRIDVIPVGRGKELVLTRGDKALNIPLPEEKLILQDGSAGTFVLGFSEHPRGLARLGKSMYSAALSLKDHPRVFVIGVGGANDVWAARLHDAALVRGVELNQAILDIHHQTVPRFSRTLLEDPRVELFWGEGRHALLA